MRLLRPLLHFSILAIVAFGMLSLMTHLMVRTRADRMADRTRTLGCCWGDPTIWTSDTPQSPDPDRIEVDK
jgi:hypothetical protein